MNKTVKTALLILGFIVILFLVGGILFGKIGLKEYSNSDVTITYPANWSVEEKTENSTYFWETKNKAVALLQIEELMDINETKFEIVDKRDFSFDDGSNRKGYIYLLNTPDRREVWMFEWEAQDSSPAGQLLVFIGHKWLARLMTHMTIGSGE